MQMSPTDEKYLLEEEKRRRRKLPPSGGEEEEEEEQQQQRRRSSSSVGPPQYDEYGFPLDEGPDAEEDLGGLMLMRTESKRPRR